MAGGIRITRARPASEGGGAIELDFIHVPEGSDVEIYRDGVLDNTYTMTGDDLEIRYTLENTGGALAQSAQGDETPMSRYQKHYPRTEVSGGLSGT